MQRGYMKKNLKNKLFNSKITKEEFLKKYWNKKPYHFKNAVPNASDLGEFSDFQEMALDPEFETRIVYETGGDYPWQAIKGPLKKTHFKKKSLWTIMCHNLELFNPDLFNIKEELNFLANWHFDDVMSTTSKKGASVGAHIDDYSVFIFQGRGKRKWLLQENPNPSFVPNIDIKLLQEFNPTMEIVLEPGDMIYIPPNVAHHGISLEDSVSYSIGFKSIRFQQLLDTMIYCDELNFDEHNFHDHQVKPIEDQFIVPDYMIKDLKNDLLKLLSDEKLLKTALIHHLSKPKNQIFSIDEFSEKDLNKILKTNIIRRDIWSKLVSTKLNSKQVLCAINRKTYPLSLGAYHLISQYFATSPHDEIIIKSGDLKNHEVKNFVLQMLNDGVFYLD